jgi:hypothetical protein
VLKLHISENVVENLRNFSDVLKTFRIPHCLTCHVMSDSLVNTWKRWIPGVRFGVRFGVRIGSHVRFWFQGVRFD